MAAAQDCFEVISYLRYSHPSQGDGDSIRRQDSEALAWCKRNNGARLNTDKRMVDRGLSAADESNIRLGALGQFLDEVEAGRILRGSVLLIENMDRLSRAKPVPAVHLLTGILLAGVRVVQLAPDEIELTEDSDLFALFRGQLSQARGHDESVTKGDRVRKAWLEKKRKARATGEVMTRQHPAWLEVLDGKFVPVADRVAAVRRAFDLAAAGHGMKIICRQLEADGFQPFGRSGRWTKSYVHRILKRREVLGEYQPFGVTDRHGRGKKKRAAEGEPVAGYYPAVVDQTTWDRAQAAIGGRLLGGRPKGGRVGRVPDLFGGLLWDAANDCRMLTMNQAGGLAGRRQKRRVLASTAANEGRVPFRTFPYRVFESAILDRLREVSAAEVLGAEPEGESGKLAAALALKDLRLKALEVELGGDAGDVPTLAAAVRKLHGERQVILRKLAEARGREANPKAEALAEMQTLADVAADPHTRLRLRSLLRTVLERVDVLIVPRRALRLVAVQVSFAGGGWRSYYLEYRPAGNGRKETSAVGDFTTDRALLDLRRKRDVATMRRVLENRHDQLDAGAERPGL